MKNWTCKQTLFDKFVYKPEKQVKNKAFIGL